MSNYQTADRGGHGCGFIHDGTLIEEAEKWAKVGERSFYNWYATLSRDEQCQVKHHMDRKG